MLGGDDDGGDAGRHAVLVAHGHLRLRVGTEFLLASAAARLRHQPENLVSVKDRRRHQLRRFLAGVAEHDALVAGALVLVAGAVDALRDVGRLLVQEHFDDGVLPVEAVLLVADVADRVARQALDHLRIDVLGAAHFAGNDDAVGRGERFAGDARLR